jgi:predicted nucleic acid-binding protein
MRPADVPAGPILVDTDVATWLLVEAPQATAWVPLLRGHTLVMSFVNVGELLAYPLVKRWQSRRTQAWAEAIRRQFVVLPYSAAMVERWAPLHVKYRGHLQKGGANDLWVAASALSADPVLPLASGNLSDFGTIAKDHPLRLVHPDLSV